MRYFFVLISFMLSCGSGSQSINVIFQAEDSIEYLNVKMLTPESVTSVGRVTKDADSGILGLEMIISDSVRISWECNGQKVEKVVPLKKCIPAKFDYQRHDVVFVLKNGNEVDLFFDIWGRNFSINRVQCGTF